MIWRQCVNNEKFFNSGSKSSKVCCGVSFIVIIWTLSPVYIWQWVIGTETLSKSISIFFNNSLLGWSWACLLSTFTSRNLLPGLWISPSADCELYTYLLQVRKKTTDYFMCFFFSLQSVVETDEFPLYGAGSRSFFLRRVNVRDSGKWHWLWHRGYRSLLSLLSVRREDACPIQKLSLPLSTGQHISSL